MNIEKGIPVQASITETVSDVAKTANEMVKGDSVLCSKKEAQSLYAALQRRQKNACMRSLGNGTYRVYCTGVNRGT